MRTWIDETIAASGGAAPCNSTEGNRISCSKYPSTFSQLGTPLQLGEIGARGVSAHRAVRREARGERGSACMKMESLPPPPSSVTDARRTTSLAQTVPLNMRGATRVCAQVAQVCASLFQMKLFAFHILSGLESFRQSVSQSLWEKQ